MTAPEDTREEADRREPVSFLVFSASLRAGSLNTRLARLVARVIKCQDGRVDMTSMSEFDSPSFDQDIYDGEGFPPGAEESRRRLEQSDAFVIVPPEHNASIPRVIKNAIDWVSRYKFQPFSAKHGLLISVSRSKVGGNRGV